ncbi:AAA family ATPase [uncultured Thiodictyon sp.]|uniref:AAA family ATPase n=1 Tax=uncultured Thiodictyon sp. TaxID=1846217 RepID=UPI0025E97478|nr:AAA family ATPase [uncultured Thiodictyon sp.]
MLDPRIFEDLQTTRTRLLEQGALLTKDALNACYDLFRRRFGPEVLAGLDGEELLNLMHLHGNHDSLVYWLEFKDDEEFPVRFGSIAGGSALKFGLYRRNETGEWMTGAPTQQRKIEIGEAVSIARRHRDQLIAGARLLEVLPAVGTPADYAELQRRMDEVAPDVSRLAWGHKYLSLLYPERLDDYHSEGHQRFHLIKLLQTPPEQSGRYVVAEPFTAIARELDWPMNHLTTVLNERNGGRPYRVWRIGTVVYDDTDIWPLMRDRPVVAIGWHELGDLGWLDDSAEGLDRLKQRLRDANYPQPNQAGVASRKAGEIRNFVRTIATGDLVVACNGQTVRGIGRVTTDAYRYDPSPEPLAPHHRAVQWLDIADWQLPIFEGPHTTVFRLRKYPENLVAIENRLLDAVPPPHPVPEPLQMLLLDGISGELQAILERKGQVILYGPPGTGKTWHARQTVQDLAAIKAFVKRYADLDPPQQAEVDGDRAKPGLVRVCTFHPAYGYEDFLEGYRPTTGNDGQLSFERRDGIFKRLCTDAAGRPDRHFYLLIDEINRGDIPRIFGELLTLLEKDKRGQAVHLPLSGEPFTVPANVFVIGTMNTADRSIALLDTALRRRFGFRELMPDTSLLVGKVVAGSIPLDGWLTALNLRILEHIGRDARNLQIGHAYLLDGGQAITDFSRFVRVLAEDIVPLLEEYCYEDYDTLREILGAGLVDQQRRRIRRELFDPNRRDELIQALLAPTPDLATTAGMTEQEPPVDASIDDEEDNGGEEAADGPPA